jgi:hypothetical protein
MSATPSISTRKSPRHDPAIAPPPVTEESREEEEEEEEESSESSDNEESSDFKIFKEIMKNKETRDKILRAMESASKPKKTEKKVNFSNAIRTLANSPKLTTENWHSWRRGFILSIKGIGDAEQYIQGKFKPGDEEYSQKVDNDIVRCIQISIDTTVPHNVNHIITQGPNEESQSAYEIYKQLERELTRMDEYKKSQTLEQLSRLKMKGFDIREYIREMNDIITQALAIGQVIRDIVKLTHINNATAKIFRFQNTLENLRVNGRGQDYQYICQVLIAGQDNMEKIQMNNKTQIHRTNIVQETPNTELYWKGKRDSRYPEKPALCYNCGKPGHIARVCKEEKTHATVPYDKKDE